MGYREQIFLNNYDQGKYNDWMQGKNIPNNNYLFSLLAKGSTQKCHITGLQLTQNELYPSNAVTAHTHKKEVYDHFISNHRGANCSICKLNRLTQFQIDGQYNGCNREISNHLCPECQKIWDLSVAYCLSISSAIQIVDTLRLMFSNQINSYFTQQGKQIFNYVDQNNALNQGYQYSLPPAKNHETVEELISRVNRTPEKKGVLIRAIGKKN